MFLRSNQMIVFIDIFMNYTRRSNGTWDEKCVSSPGGQVPMLGRGIMSEKIS